MEDNITNAIDLVVKQLSQPNEKDYIGMKTSIRDALEYFRIAMYPSFIGKDLLVCQSCSTAQKCISNSDSQRRKEAFTKAADELIKALSCVVPFKKACDTTEELITKIPSILTLLDTDIQAAYEGDPAAVSRDEVILAYPAFQAISIFRIAHELYLMQIPSVPRIMTEYAHELTGIDIHPGATIGKYFFIDHGTGVVIGETTTIGNHVKIYQHVTLGAKSFDVKPDGTLIKGIKRHPDIGNNVVIYAGATILGGNTVIGDNCVIGGNVWLTHSVAPGQTVLQK